MPQPDDGKLRKVRALLAKAEGAATEQEADAYRDKATELMAEYGIDAALAQAHTPANTTPLDKIVELDNPRANIKVRLLGFLAETMRCQAIHLPRRRGQGGPQRLHLFGYTSDLERVEVMYTSLLVQMENGLARITTAPPGVGIRAYRHAWAVGFVSRVTDRIGEIELDATLSATRAAGTSTALVLADRQRQVEAQRRAQYPRIVYGRSSANSRGLNDGRAAGDRADIGQGRVGGRRALTR